MRFQKIILHKKNRSGSRKSDESERFFCVLRVTFLRFAWQATIGTTYIRDATCIGFCVNELLSIIENTSLMGIPYPPAIKKAIEVLQKRAAHIDDEIQEIIDNMEDDKK